MWTKYTQYYVLVIGLTFAVGLGQAWAAAGQHGHQPDRTPNIMEYIDRLDRPERDQYQKPAQVMEALALKPGMSIADIGSGSGYFTSRFAEAVSHSGKVYAVDVEPKALDYIKEGLARTGSRSSVEFVLARPDDPTLPDASIDLIFICNTFHHLDNRPQYFRNLRSVLKPRGRIAIIDYFHDERSGDLGFPKDHLVAREAVLSQMSEAGYRLISEHDFLPRQYFLEFAPR